MSELTKKFKNDEFYEMFLSMFILPPMPLLWLIIEFTVELGRLKFLKKFKVLDHQFLPGNEITRFRPILIIITNKIYCVFWLIYNKIVNFQKLCSLLKFLGNTV